MPQVSKLLFCILIYLGSLAPLSAEPLPQATLYFLKSNFAEYRLQDTVSGDLDGDSIPETIVLLSHSERFMQRVLVLRGVANVTPALVSASKTFNACQHGTELYIDKNSLFISCFHSGDGTLSSYSRYQFSIRSRKLQLIGEEFSARTGTDAKPDPKYPDRYTSTNYLTGKTIETTKWKGRVLSQKRTKFALPERAPKFLEDFEFEF